MPTIQPADLWRESGRYDDYGKEMLRITDRHERDMLFGPTNEEMVTDIFRAYVSSYRALPLNLYHIQWKFRDEVRPRFGVMRGREFLMKDAYSFDIDDDGGARRLQQDVRRLSAHLRAHGPDGDPDARRDRADRRRPEPRVHRARRDRRERGLSATRDILELPVPGEDVDYDADLRRSIEPWTSLLRRDRGHARRGALRARGARGAAAQHARHRGRPDLLLRHQIFRADGRQGRRPRRQSSSSSTWAPTASASRGWSARSSRRATTRPASSGRTASRRSQVGLINLKAGDADGRRGRRRRSTSVSRMPESQCFTMISTSAPGRNSRPWT